MSTYSFAQAMGRDAAALARQCAGELGRHDGGLGFLYVSDQLAGDLRATLTTLRQETGVQDWVGSVGVGVCATGHEYFREPALTALVAEIDTPDYRVFDTVQGDLSGFRAQCGGWLKAAGSRFAIVHGDPRNNALPSIVEGLAETMDGFLVGGISSSRRQALQIAGGVTEGGVSGALLSENVAVATALSQSCSLIGSKHVVTRAEANVLVELDGRPALEVFREDVGELLARDLRRIEGYIFVALPIAGTDTGDYLVRHIIGFDKSRQLVGISDIASAGQSIQFCRRDAEAAETDLVRMIGTLKRRANAAPKGAVYYSCVARGPNMFGDDSNELRLIQRELGDVPLVGFFCYGEISHNRLYGYTGVLTLFL